jgi:hypothetical protein
MPDTGHRIPFAARFDRSATAASPARAPAAECVQEEA